ncbi:MAG TPA: DUF2000 domain-containing protein [Patescibacteria group bacterium]|nr:DUF2000 domain-containing protein [Patescibacteria group bacterium]
MSNQDVTTHKFVAILNKKITVGKVMNVLAHITVSLVAQIPLGQVETVGIVDYRDRDNNSHKASKNSFVILAADNSNQIRNIKRAAQEKGIMFVDFTDTMQEGTYLDQLARTKETHELLLEYYGIVLFGTIEQVSELTRKFSLWH